MRKVKYDTVIVGSGVSGLYAALQLPFHRRIAVICKGDLEECDSYLAQGGICVLRDDKDYDNYFEDTMRAGHYENRQESVEIMIRSSQDVIGDLIEYGVDFAKDEEGNYLFTKEGAHSKPRILYHEDITGQEITSKLLREVKQPYRNNIDLYPNTTMIDWLIDKKTNSCQGIVAKDNDDIIIFKSDNTILATGGIGGLFEHSTNYPILTGDSLALALKYDVELENPNYIQIHPTTLYTNRKERSFLISESVRGEGGILLNKNGERFVNELLPRDVVANAIFNEMKKTDSKHVYLSMENIDKKEITTHFCHIYQHCLEEGYDCTKEAIPVVPAQHYFMGGIHVDKDSKTSINNLYAVGETSCNGVHGRNRLASNSLLESLVFAKRSAKHIARHESVKGNIAIKIDAYNDIDKLLESYKEMVIKEIERVNKEYETRQDYNETQHRSFDFIRA